MSKIAAIANVHLLPETEEQINQLSGNQVTFPTEDTQPSLDELISRTDNADVVLVSPGTQITRGYIEACPSLKYVGVCGTSMENVDLDAANNHDVKVTNVTDYGDEPTAEFIFMQLTRLLRGIGDYQWQQQPHELMGKTMGIIGLGALGKSIASLALAYKMNVQYFSRNRKPDWEGRGLQYKDKYELLKSSDILVISSPTNMEVINKDEFDLIKQNSILVQASMGDCFDKEGFEKWIKNENNFAIFDYAAGSSNYDAYKDLPRVVFPKVIAGHTVETKQRLGQGVVTNLKEYLGSV